MSRDQPSVGARLRRQAADRLHLKQLLARAHGQELVLKLRLREAAASKGALRPDQSMQPPSQRAANRCMKRRSAAKPGLEKRRRGHGRLLLEPVLLPSLQGQASAGECRRGLARMTGSLERAGPDPGIPPLPACLDDLVKHAGQLVKLTEHGRADFAVSHDGCDGELMSLCLLNQRLCVPKTSSSLQSLQSSLRGLSTQC